MYSAICPPNLVHKHEETYSTKFSYDIYSASKTYILDKLFSLEYYVLVVDSIKGIEYENFSIKKSITLIILSNCVLSCLDYGEAMVWSMLPKHTQMQSVYDVLNFEFKSHGISCCMLAKNGSCELLGYQCPDNRRRMMFNCHCFLQVQNTLILIACHSFHDGWIYEFFMIYNDPVCS